MKLTPYKQLETDLKKIESIYKSIIDYTTEIEDDPNISLVTRGYFISNDMLFRKNRITITEKLTELSKIIGTDEGN